MKLSVIGSGSSGNAYALIADSGEILLIEAGCPLLHVKKAIDFRISDVVGCLSSHAHNDHSKFIISYLQAGIKVFADHATGRGSKHYNLMPLIGDFTIGGFRVKPFNLQHDVENHGFLINHHESGNILFVTDAVTIPYDFPDLNQMIVEANYSEPILEENICSGRVNLYLGERIRKTHLSLESLKVFLNETDKRKLMNIVLIHLSNDNSNSEAFQRDIAQLSLANVHVAEAGLLINFDVNPF